MSKRTQKAGATARFGSRYGVSVRRRAGSAMSKKSRKYTCPNCQYPKVRREVAGIWKCRKCNHTFSGGVWEPYTRASDANRRIVRRSQEGATATDMTVIAQQAALEYERKITERESDEESEEE
ncbi:MAG: 50S ribosomal protein L37ae [Euryarchaeota archaeon]|nr:50S ribosomal protein L37ae [Euryarchaeota archaeon]|tara:strand:+ start:1325 stop:1693 length:369 start_codon:yes stop_codon:yes gene_type:complete